MRILSIILFLTLSVVYNPLNAQFGKIKNALKKNASKNSITIDWDKQRHLPAVSLSSFLINDGIKLELDGTLKLEALEISFLPKKDSRGERIIYDPYKKVDFLLTADLLQKGKTKAINTFYFTVNPVGQPFSLMSAIHRPKDDIRQSIQVTEGDYTLEFKVAEKHIHSISFSVLKAINDDTYAAMNEMYFLDGPWNRYGRLSFTENVGKEPLMFEFYILNNTTDIENEHRPNKQKEMKFSFQLYKNEKVVAANYVEARGEIQKTIANGARGHWNIAGAQCVKYPARRDQRGVVQEYFTKSDLTDGVYKIVLEKELFKGGSEKIIYKFQVKNQRITPLKEADRNKHNDINTFIEQGPEYHFITHAN